MLEKKRVLVWAIRTMAMAAGLPFWFSSCKNTTNRTVENREVINKQYCFKRISGNERRDTLTISLNIIHHLVTGKMSDVIFEKDARRGRLTGQLNKNSITATWIYIQEGTVETLRLQFLLNNGQLMMAPLLYNTQSGQQEIDTSSLTWITIPESDCPLSTDDKGFTASGTIIDVVPGKDGYTSRLHQESGDTVQITMSRVRLQQKYTALKVGEKVIVSGDTIHLNHEVIILVDLYSKIK